jgi:multicomponent K+:H+ antiporter subunit E
MPGWLPHPYMSLTLVLVWLLLVNEVSLGHVLLGTLLGVVIPYYTSSFWPERPHPARPGLLLVYLLRVLGDILVANLQVARLVLGPAARLRPALIPYPLELTDEFAITMLASTISLTPGTVSADVSPDRRTLLIHVLSTEDPDALCTSIRARYEAPLKEMFR